jgi:hypothetical protein
VPFRLLSSAHASHSRGVIIQIARFRCPAPRWCCRTECTPESRRRGGFSGLDSIKEVGYSQPGSEHSSPCLSASNQSSAGISPFVPLCAQLMFVNSEMENEECHGVGFSGGVGAAVATAMRARSDTTLISGSSDTATRQRQYQASGSPCSRPLIPGNRLETTNNHPNSLPILLRSSHRRKQRQRTSVQRPRRQWIQGKPVMQVSCALGDAQC